MKRFSILRALILSAALGSAASAGAQVATVLKPIQLGVALGGAIPLSDLGKSFNTGYNFTGTLGINPAGMPVGFRIDGAYDQFGAKGATKVNAKIAGVSGNVVYTLPGIEMAPYLIGGVGYNHVSATAASAAVVVATTRLDIRDGQGTLLPRFATVASGTGSTKATNDFGFNVGGGLKIPLSGFTAFVEARYNHISVNGGSLSYLPITVGVMF